MVLHVPRTRHLGGHVHHSGGHGVVWQDGAQPLGVVHAVLQAQHQRVGFHIRADQGAGRFGVGGLHTEQHQVGALHRAGLAAGAQAQVLIERGGLQAQAVARDCLHVLRPRDQRYRVPGARQHAAKVAAHGACAHDGDLDG
jgi:hypothetical protein